MANRSVKHTPTHSPCSSASSASTSRSLSRSSLASTQVMRLPSATKCVSSVKSSTPVRSRSSRLPTPPSKSVFPTSSAFESFASSPSQCRHLSILSSSVSIPFSLRTPTSTFRRFGIGDSPNCSNSGGGLSSSTYFHLRPNSSIKARAESQSATSKLRPHLPSRLKSDLQSPAETKKHCQLPMRRANSVNVANQSQKCDPYSWQNPFPPANRPQQVNAMSRPSSKSPLDDSRESLRSTTSQSPLLPRQFRRSSPAFESRRKLSNLMDYQKAGAKTRRSAPCQPSTPIRLSSTSREITPSFLSHPLHESAPILSPRRIQPSPDALSDSEFFSPLQSPEKAIPDLPDTWSGPLSRIPASNREKTDDSGIDSEDRKNATTRDSCEKRPPFVNRDHREDRQIRQHQQLQKHENESQVGCEIKQSTAPLVKMTQNSKRVSFDISVGTLYTTSQKKRRRDCGTRIQGRYCNHSHNDVDLWNDQSLVLPLRDGRFDIGSPLLKRTSLLQRLSILSEVTKCPNVLGDREDNRRVLKTMNQKANRRGGRFSGTHFQTPQKSRRVLSESMEQLEEEKDSFHPSHNDFDDEDKENILSSGDAANHLVIGNEKAGHDFCHKGVNSRTKMNENFDKYDFKYDNGGKGDDVENGNSSFTGTSDILNAVTFVPTKRRSTPSGMFFLSNPGTRTQDPVDRTKLGSGRVCIQNAQNGEEGRDHPRKEDSSETSASNYHVPHCDEESHCGISSSSSWLASIMKDKTEHREIKFTGTKDCRKEAGCIIGIESLDSAETERKETAKILSKKFHRPDSGRLGNESFSCKSLEIGEEGCALEDKEKNRDSENEEEVVESKVDEESEERWSGVEEFSESGETIERFGNDMIQSQKNEEKRTNTKSERALGPEMRPEKGEENKALHSEVALSKNGEIGIRPTVDNTQRAKERSKHNIGGDREGGHRGGVDEDANDENYEAHVHDCNKNTRDIGSDESLKSTGDDEGSCDHDDCRGIDGMIRGKQPTDMDCSESAVTSQADPRRKVGENSISEWVEITKGGEQNGRWAEFGIDEPLEPMNCDVPEVAHDNFTELRPHNDSGFDDQNFPAGASMDETVNAALSQSEDHAGHLLTATTVNSHPSCFTLDGGTQNSPLQPNGNLPPAYIPLRRGPRRPIPDTGKSTIQGPAQSTGAFPFAPLFLRSSQTLSVPPSPDPPKNPFGYQSGRKRNSRIRGRRRL